MFGGEDKCVRVCVCVLACVFRGIGRLSIRFREIISSIIYTLVTMTEK